MSFFTSICRGGARFRISRLFCRVVLWWNDCPIGQLEDVGEVSRILDPAVLSETVSLDIREGALKIVGDGLRVRKRATTTSIVICQLERIIVQWLDVAPSHGPVHASTVRPLPRDRRLHDLID